MEAKSRAFGHARMNTEELKGEGSIIEEEEDDIQEVSFVSKDPSYTVQHRLSLRPH